MTTGTEVQNLPATRKWDATTLGPRQLREFKDHLSKMSWEAQTQTEITDWGERSFVGIGGGYKHPLYQPLMDDLMDAYDAKATPGNYQDILRDVQDAIKKLKETRPKLDKRKTPEQIAERDEQTRQREAVRRAEREESEKTWREIVAKAPRGAGAVIVACLEEDKSDMMSDYHGSETVRRVAIGFRTGSREDFRQLRAAAATFPKTAHLGPGCDLWSILAPQAIGDTWGFHVSIPSADGEDIRYFTTETEAKSAAEAYRQRLDAEVERDIAEYGAWAGSRETALLRQNGYILHKESVEHRDNYSMGKGNWVGVSRYSGWSVSSYGMDYFPGKIEDCIPASAPAPGPTPTTAPIDGVQVSENESKDGVEVRFPAKPAAEVLEGLKAAGFRWSRFSACWYARRNEKTLAYARGLK